MKKNITLLFLTVALLFSCNNDDDSKSPLDGGQKQIVVEMTNTEVTDVAGTYNLNDSKEYSVREDGKYKILLVTKKVEDEEGKLVDTLMYGILDVKNNIYLYFTKGIDAASRLEKDWEYYDEEKNQVCTSKLKE